MSCDNCNGKELAQQPFELVCIKVLRGFCPMCSAKLEHEIENDEHKVIYCETCGHKITWEELFEE